MAEEHTQQQSPRGKSRRERVEYARSRDILDVASELNMELVRSGRDYRWKEHDSMVISPEKNMWNWFSRHQGGDVIALVQTMKEVNFNQAIDFLNDGTFKEFTHVKRVQEPFTYYLQPYEQPFEAARDYLKEQRGLSDETIDFFLEKGVLAQANAKVNGSIEPVVVFKSFDFSGEIVGATLQGIEENWEKWPERGYAKNIVRNSDGITGMHIDIGQPNRLIFAESAIDLMSYYELHKDSLQDVRLISMDGVKEAVVGRHLAQLQSELLGRPLRWSHEQLADGLQTAIDNNFFADGNHADWITLAVDNDEAGRNFIDSLREKGASIVEDLPDLQPGQDKTDWNDTLKNSPNEFTDAVDELSVTVDQSSRINFLNQLNQNSAVTPVRPVTVLKQNELYSDYWRVYQSDGNLEFYLSEDGQFGYRQYGSLNPKEDNIIFKFHSKEETTDFLATQMGYDSLKYIVNKDWESLFDSDKALLRENYVFKDLENFLQNSNAFELDYWTFDDGLKQAQKVARQDEEFLNEITKKDLTKTRSEEQGGLFENLADATSTSDRAQVSYDTFKANQERLSEVVQSQIQAGALRITLSDEAYFYTLVNYTGWSHPMQQLKPKAVESLKEYRTFFESINDTNIDRFKEKGTPEQNQMYDLLKGLQKDLGRSSTSTVFSEEVAISAYNLNRRLNSLTAENWGKGITDPLGSLGRDTWNVISYPANDIVTDNTDYYDQLVPYHLLEYLNGKNGTVEISPETYETILQQLRDESIIITPEVVEDVTTSPEQVVSSSEETEKPLEVHQGQDVSEQQKKEVQLKDIRTLHREWEQELENKVTQFLGHTPQWWELERNRGAFITSELDQLFAKRSSLKLDAHFADNSQYVRQEIKQLDEQILTIIQQEKAPERTQEQAVSEQQKNERMYQRKGSLQPEAEGSTSPVLETSTFERSVTSRPTVSSQYLNFSIKDGFKSRKTKYEKSIDAYNLGKLNRRGIDIQEAAQFYLNELANSTVHYFTSDGSLVQVNFLEENFLHLTGLKIIGDAATPGKILHDFANGGELSYDDIRLKNTESPFDKIKVLPDLETVLQTDSFYFDDLQDIPRYQGRFDSLIKSDDSDLMLLFRMNTEDGTVPVSVFKARQVLRVELQEARKNEILGIFREKGGLIEQIDINKNYVKDDGEEMLSILKNRQYEESRDINDQSMNVSSYSFNHQDYSDIDSLLEAGSAYLQTTEGQEWLARDPEYHQELLDVFESAGATPKQKLEVMSEFGNIQVNGYDIVAGLGYSEALSDDALFFDQNAITEITEQGFVQEKPIQTRIDQQQLESLRNYFSGQMDKVEIGIGHSGAGVDYRAYYLRNSYDNRIEIAATDLGSELSPEEQLDALMNKIVENYGKSFWDLVQQPDFELSDEEAHQLAYPIVTQESLSEVFGYSPDVITEEKLQTPEPISAELFTQVLDSAYNVGDPRKLGLQVPEESKRAWERYYELSDSYEGNFSAVVDAADQLSLVDKNSNFYQDWQQDQIYNDTYHVRLRGSNEGLISPQWPFEPTHFVSYQDFVTELYKANQDASQTQPIAFDIYAPGGALIKDGVRYAVGDETQPVSRLLGLGYRRLEDYPNLAAIDEEVLSQLENQEVNQDIAAEANEQTVASPETPQERDSREDFQSPKQDIRTGLAQRVEEIMAEDAAKILVSSIPQVQENLSVEGDLIGAPQPDGQMLYTNQEDFGRDYQLELTVHSPVKIDQLSDIQAPWTLALIQGEQKLGYLAYGSDWGNDFQVKKELEQLASQIGAGNSPEGLYQQEEIDAFLTNNRGQASNYRTQENISSAESFDYATASAYDISERAFQKIREYTQSPEDLLEYVEFMSKFPQLSPRNVALIQEQWRGANAVATYDQWKSMGEALGIKPEDVIQTKATYVNKRTGETKEVVHQGLSVKSGEKSQITLFRPLMVRMIPVIDESGNHVKNDKGNPKYKKFSDATPQEKELVKEGKLPVRQFQERDPKTGQPRFTTYKVFELSQTTLKPESYPKAMPNRHYNFNTDKVKTKEVLEGLCDYAESIGVSIMKDEAHVLGNAKGAFFPGEQLILINPDNTPGEKIATTIHELAHATLHNPNLADQYKELPKVQKELEAEMTSHLLSKHFGLDTTEKAIDYMAKWTDNLKGLDDKQLANSLKRIHKTVSKMHKQIEHHTKPYQLGKSRGQGPNFPKAPTKGPSR